MIKVRKATINDVTQIVAIHSDAFADFFLTSLGPRFLAFYYSCFIRSSDGIVICAEENSNIIGFAASTKKCRGFNSKLIKNNIYYFISLSFKLLLINPKALIRLARNVTKTSSEVVDAEDYAELYSIAVKKGGQGKGVGKELLLAIEDILKMDNVKRLSLTTDYFNNEVTIGFYKSMKFEVLYEFVTYPQRRMYRFIKEL